MPWYQYTGQDESGKRVNGHIGANDAEHAMDLLALRKFDIDSLIEIESPPSPPQGSSPSASSSPNAAHLSSEVTWLDGVSMVITGVILGLIALIIALTGRSVPVLWVIGQVIGAIAGLFLTIGIIRWAVEPLMRQNRRIIKLLERRDGNNPPPG